MSLVRVEPLETVAITGAARGIGKAAAEEAIDRGASRLWLLDINREELETTASELRAGGTCTVGTAVVDLASPTAVVAAVAEWSDTALPTVVVNSAGVGSATALQDTSDDEWARTIAVNLTGTFNLLRAVSTRWIDQALRGTFVAIASVAGESGFSGRAAYCASKAGVVGLTRAAALDLAPHGIRVIAVSPGFIQTEMSHSDNDAFVGRTVPLGRRGRPEELVELLFDMVKSPLLTGSSIVADGGLLAGYRL